MSNLIIQPSVKSTTMLALPEPRVPISIRPAVMSDIPFMDGLQKMHSKMVGFMPTAQFEGNIKAGRVLVAWASRPCSSEDQNMGETPMLREEPVGYCIGVDRYFKRDDVGIVYQLNVMPGKQRGLIGAALLKAQFERSAYGCKLYCCWCAQDIAANKFWEAMGFVALAFRTGGTGNKKSGPRMHIFWQKRIRQGDESTPWWFPSETSGGAIKENRIVLPIPPGTHWSEAKPIVLPTAGVPGQEIGESAKALPGPRKPRVKKVVGPVIPKNSIQAGGLRFGPAVIAGSSELAKVEEKAEKKVRPKNDPKLVAAARELRDRWQEHVADGGYVFESKAKYEVGRLIEQGRAEERVVEVKQLAA